MGDQSRYGATNGPDCGLRLQVKRMADRQDRVFVSGMALRGADVAGAAVAMVMVVPMHETHRPAPGKLDVSEALGGKLRAILFRAEQRLGRDCRR